MCLHSTGPPLRPTGEPSLSSGRLRRMSWANSCDDCIRVLKSTSFKLSKSLRQHRHSPAMPRASGTQRRQERAASGLPGPKSTTGQSKGSIEQVKPRETGCWVITAHSWCCLQHPEESRKGRPRGCQEIITILAQVQLGETRTRMRS